VSVRLEAVHHLRDERDGPPLVLLHGAGANALVWEPLRRELSSFDLFAPSLPGRLGTEGEAFARADDAARWLRDVLEALGAPHAIVVGHSYGGAVALELALLGAPLAGLVLVGSGARLRVHPAILEGARQAAERGAPMPTRLAFGAASSSPAAEAYERAAEQTPPSATLRDWQACDGFDAMARLGDVSVPTLVVGGEDDALTPPKYQQYLADHLPRAQLTRVSGAGHMLPWEKPRDFAAIVRAYVASL
jgi:pimeloyl-ACP methyl ester carboxylesterase